MREENVIMFRNRLVKVYRHLGKQAKKEGVSCYRVYDHDLPDFPLRIEFYGDCLYVAEYKRRHGMTESEHESWMERSLQVIEDVLSVGKENIFLKLRMRKPGRLGQYQKQPTGQGLAGKETVQEFIVEENGLKFIVNLSDYLDTGLFLDHRITRQMVKEQGRGKKILNLFAYTGSFSVYAAVGDAEEVITVDLSRTYLSWAGRNLELNGFRNESKYKFIHADVLEYINTLPSNYFDIIIMDPPTFSNSKRMENFMDIQRDHTGLINKALASLNTGGILYFSTNYTKFVLEKEKLEHSVCRDITKATTPFDFKGRSTRLCFQLSK